MFKKSVLFILLCCSLGLNAQHEHNIKLGVEAGILPFSENSDNLGLFLYVEPKVKIFDNAFLGMRVGLTLNSHVFQEIDIFEFSIDQRDDNGIFSFVPTIDYYLNENYLRPYIGLGIGYHLSSDIDVSRAFIVDPAEDTFEVRLDKRIGLLLRGGIESGKLRFGLEYNLIPKADITIPNGEIAGTVANSYVGLSIGFIFGNGKRLE